MLFEKIAFLSFICRQSLIANRCSKKKNEGGVWNNSLFQKDREEMSNLFKRCVVKFCVEKNDR